MLLYYSTERECYSIYRAWYKSMMSGKSIRNAIKFFKVPNPENRRFSFHSIDLNNV